MRGAKIAILAAALLLGAQAPPPDWRAIAAADLPAARDAIATDTPLLHVKRDAADAAMRDWLDAGYRKAEALLPRIADETGYRYLIGYYFRGFRDGHIAAGPHDGYRPAPLATRAWPGIATAWRDGRYVVSGVAPWVAQPPAAGAELVGCDGRTAEALARERLDLWDANLDLALDRRLTASRLLWDRGNPFVPLPRRCRFRDAAGRLRAVTLAFRAADQAELRAAAASSLALAARPALDVTRWDERGWWIGIPSLGGDQDWEGFYAKVAASRDAIRAAPAVVIDLRGNSGGSTMYARRLADMLWGEALIAAHRKATGPAQWRASPAVRANAARLAERLAGNPTERASAAWARGVVTTLDRAIAEGRPLVEEPGFRPPPRAGAPPSNPMRGRAVLLTDERCFSACLDMLDILVGVPGVVQAGLPSGADTIFLEVMAGVLPSGRLGYMLPTKAMPLRPRGSNVAYVPAPAFTYRGDPGDEAAWRSWLAAALER